MKPGTKKYYVDAFKHVMMTNLTASESQTLAATQSYYAQEIENAATINEEDKAIYLNNLYQAFNEVVREVVGQPEEEN